SIVYSITEVGVSYLTDGIVIFNHLLANTNYNNDSLLYGEASMAGILGVFSHFLQFLSLGKIVIPIEGVSTEVSTFYEVGNNKTLNGYTTMYYYFYRDFGVIGIIIFTAVLALIAILAYKKVKRNPSFFNQIIYVNIMLVVFFGILRWELARTEIVMRIVYTFFIVIFIFYKPIKFKKRIVKNEK
ncbi:O-antigen polymerase, partial [Priestia megaterium]|uniref:O-antigen polymerase n=2 Tax=Bacillaceae TaxID=186817 RepID=UPI0033915D35